MVSKLGKPMDKYNLAIAEQKMIDFKREIWATARLQMEQWIQEGCNHLNMCVNDTKRMVKNINDLKYCFIKDGSVDNCVKMWYIMIGQFEASGKSPFKDFETLYMEKQKWQYTHM